MVNLSLSEQITYSTVRIECDYYDGTSGTGTGFFFQFLKNETTGEHIPAVITNKHVINGSTRGRLIFTKANANNEPIDTQHFQIYFDNFEALWRKHPDTDVDLCAMPIAPFVMEASNRGDKLFYISLDKSQIPNSQQLAELSVLEEILMIGYPNGIWDHVNNKPILRRGVTASSPNLNYCGKKEIMIDAACFPGSSGSPVFIFNEGGYRDKRGSMYFGKSRVILLGILYAGPQHTTEGDIQIIDVPINQRTIAISRIPNNLGLIIKSERILELERLFLLK